MGTKLFLYALNNTFKNFEFVYRCIKLVSSYLFICSLKHKTYLYAYETLKNLIFPAIVIWYLIFLYDRR